MVKKIFEKQSNLGGSEGGERWRVERLVLVVEEDDEGVERELAKVDGGWWRRRATISCDGV